MTLLRNKIVYLVSLFAFFCSHSLHAQITHHQGAKTIKVKSKDQKLALLIDYADGCRISSLLLDNRELLAPEGAYTGMRTTAVAATSAAQSQDVEVAVNDQQVIIKGIQLGDIQETWTFSPQEGEMVWTIKRTYPNDIALEEMALPVWHFADLNTFKGGILDNGGMVWNKYLSSVHDTYGVHTGGVTFWHEDYPGALQLAVESEEEQQIANKFSHHEQGYFTCTTLLTDIPLKQRYNLSRFVHQKPDVFAAFTAKKGTETVHITLRRVDYQADHNRGNLVGIDASAVRELLNTTGRYGVVDNGIVGANGWLTNWKCLHEPFFAQIGLAVNDPNYTKNLAHTLNQERDFAIKEDGRVLSRWHDVLGDEITGTYDKETGYYEAKWGYTVDSQTGYIINAVELFHQTGDVDWLRAHKATAESALNWLIRRDSNHNGLFEMVNQNVSEQQASDWIDIVWASFENAFVNAQMYEALRLWAECEEILGDVQQAAYYQSVASKLKQAFNKTVEEGGFWSPEKKQYIYWRDADGTPRGDNMVTPVNFAAIAFGICDDPDRVHTILAEIERRTAAENLFHWPLCFDSFRREEVHSNNWPFPKYENGDIFPTWGYLGVRSYVKYDKQLAVKYIRKILAQYRKDGLSSQRYSRVDQSGLGDDILSGISTTVTALYSDIYGIEPRWNRLGLRPNMISELDGTQFSYTLRDQVYEVQLDSNHYQLATDKYRISSASPFGMGWSTEGLVYYHDNKEEQQLILHSADPDVKLDMLSWNKDQQNWKMEGANLSGLTFTGLIPNQLYQITINGKKEKFRSGQDGKLSYTRNFTLSSNCVLNRIRS